MIGRISRIVIVSAVVVLAGWAVVAAVWGGPGESISSHVRDYSHLYPAIPFALGVLLGHWLGPTHELAWFDRVAFAMGGAGMATVGHWLSPSWAAPVLFLVGGFIAGAFLWRMGPPQPRDGRSIP